jgi:hypothetical protein
MAHGRLSQAMQQVGSLLGYGNRAPNVLGKAARDPNLTSSGARLFVET